MKHLGDITKIHGAIVEPVEVIIGGSPCQDLSVAGKRAGLDGERSGLFMEQIRIIKEMRESDKRAGRTGKFCRSRFMVWENVPGAFSSNKGEDFRIVLEETAKIADPEISIPRPPQGKWTNAGAIVGNGFSIAWRVLDAQYFGVPQRRRRIALVADFGGDAAPEILFKRKGVSGNFEKSERKEKTSAEYFKKHNYRIFENHPTDSRVKELTDVSETVVASYGTGGGNRPIILREKMLFWLSVTETERLQGYPDGWTDIGEWIDSKGKKHKDADSPRYKALGNSIAVPCWRFILERISERTEEHTMASLFDGIGGFPLIWEQINGSKACRWVSEIEEFPIAVTKMRFEQE